MDLPGNEGDHRGQDEENGAVFFDCFQVQGLGFKVQSSRFKVQGSKFKVQGLRFAIVKLLADNQWVRNKRLSISIQ